LVIVVWHPYAHDTLNMNPDDSIRMSRFQHNAGQPSLILDGYLEVVMPSDPVRYFEEFGNAIVGVKSNPTYAFVEATGTADSAQAQVFLWVAIDSVAPGTQPTLYCVVMEDSLTDPLGATYSRTPQALVPDGNGIPLNLARGDTLTDTLTFDMTGHVPRNMCAAIFIEDAAAAETHRVLQAATINRLEFVEDK
jgi:hypothetical protein